MSDEPLFANFAVFNVQPRFNVVSPDRLRRIVSQIWYQLIQAAACEQIRGCYEVVGGVVSVADKYQLAILGTR
ncbi:MAG: hypothetical protein IPH82_27020 [Chloroflexi bacterium]|nr:hypothetical protein [Chloroflexota bacterium]